MPPPAWAFRRQSIDNTLYDAFGQRQVSTIYERYNQHHVILEVGSAISTGPGVAAKNLRQIHQRRRPGAACRRVAKFEPSNAYLVGQSSGPISGRDDFLQSCARRFARPGDGIDSEGHEELQDAGERPGKFSGNGAGISRRRFPACRCFAAALVAVYIVLGMLYESLIHPITILSTLPSAGVGALLALMVCGQELSLVSFIGIILLMGIVKKNAIMMIDFAAGCRAPRKHRRPRKPFTRPASSVSVPS